MEAKTRLFFEDGVYHTDPSTFVDYPKIKIRSYDRQEGRLFTKVMLCTYVFVVISGLVFLFA